ncbi:MAG: hypothetical protein B6I20_10275 [Bacteroidetes bacterium 4572_117]|nr:MAG: hypothetical protein B6I20_10275 [Bacteroidetes bacterium 4572_117]
MKFAAEFLFYFVIIVVIYLLIRNILGIGRKTVSVKKINILFKKIDKKYELFLKKQVHNIFLTKENHKIEIEKLADLCMTVIKPQIDGIYALVRLKGKPDGGINFSSKYFEGVIAITEALLIRDSKVYKLTEKDKKDFYNAFKINMISDITERIYINEEEID